MIFLIKLEGMENRAIESSLSLFQPDRHKKT